MYCMTVNSVNTTHFKYRGKKTPCFSMMKTTPTGSEGSERQKQVIRETREIRTSYELRKKTFFSM